MGAYRLVVVDDSQNIRDLIRAAFAESDFDVVGEAANGIEAIEVVLDAKPDIVLMDIEMPLMDGIEATRHLSVRVPETSIFGFTGSSGADRDEMVKAGAVDVLEKGSLAEVFETLERWAEERKSS
jgi:two-component system, NarL family, response regulator